MKGGLHFVQKYIVISLYRYGKAMEMLEMFVPLTRERLETISFFRLPLLDQSILLFLLLHEFKTFQHLVF